MKSAKFVKNSELGGQSEFEQLLESSFAYTPPRRGEIRNAIILQIETREIIVDMGAKQDGIVPAQDIERLDSEVKNGLVVGAEVPVYVLNPRDQDDNLIVSINMGLQQYDWEKARQLLKSEDVVQVSVTGQSWRYSGTLESAGRVHPQFASRIGQPCQRTQQRME